MRRRGRGGDDDGGRRWKTFRERKGCLFLISAHVYFSSITHLCIEKSKWSIPR